MNVKGLFEKFKKMVEKDYPKILIGFEKKKDYYRIFYYLEEFNINDKKFRETIGNAIRNTFYAKGILNLGQTNINYEKAKEVFPELNVNEEKDIKFIEKEVLNKKNEISQKESYFFMFNEFIMQNIIEQTFFSSLNENKKVKIANFNEKKFKYKNEDKFNVSLSTAA